MRTAQGGQHRLAVGSYEERTISASGGLLRRTGQYLLAVGLVSLREQYLPAVGSLGGQYLLAVGLGSLRGQYLLAVGFDLGRYKLLHFSSDLSVLV